MSNDLLLALQITVIGMGLVFGAILLLWGLMALLMRIAPEKESEADVQPVTAETPDLEAAARLEKERRAQAAAIAVAMALAARESGAIMEFPLPQTAIVSAWQLTSRTKTLTRRGPTR